MTGILGLLVARAEQAERERDTLREALREIAAQSCANEYGDCLHRRNGWKHPSCHDEIGRRARAALAAVSPPQEGEA